MKPLKSLWILPLITFSAVLLIYLAIFIFNGSIPVITDISLSEQGILFTLPEIFNSWFWSLGIATAWMLLFVVRTIKKGYKSGYTYIGADVVVSLLAGTFIALLIIILTWFYNIATGIIAGIAIIILIMIVMIWVKNYNYKENAWTNLKSFFKDFIDDSIVMGTPIVILVGIAMDAQIGPGFGFLLGGSMAISIICIMIIMMPGFLLINIVNMKTT